MSAHGTCASWCERDESHEGACLTTGQMTAMASWNPAARPIQEARRQDAEAYAEHLTAKGAQAAGKPRMDLIPWDAVEAIAQHFGTSAAKYPDHDWEKLDPAYSWSTYFGAMMRHAGRWALGEDYDEKGYSHAAAFATNAMMLLTYVVREHPGDDRPKVLNPGQERRA